LKVLITFAVLLTACAPIPIEESDMVINKSINSSLVEDGGETPSIESNETPDIRFEWIVEPTFSYDDIICVDEEGIIARGNGIYIDQKTGKEAGEVFGHGLDMNCLFYDEEKGLFGVLYYGDGANNINFYTETDFEPLYSWEENAWYSTLDDRSKEIITENLNIIYSIDSAVVDVQINKIGRGTALGHEYLSEYGYELEAIRGKGAIANKGIFITDFIYDDGERNGSRYFNDIIAVQKDENWGIVDKNGNTIAPFVFEEAITIDNDTAFAKYEGKVGILNLSPMSPIGIVNTPESVLDVRSVPDSSGEILGQLENQTKTIIKDEVEGFYMISYLGGNAYISKNFVDIIK
jgi:uncharacterized protein YgiM (DUF1202 family)